ncbi:MFS transporter [Dyella sp.]|uniref:MFS transporter n=1 Tax=Dyella sp. TaxID=1869338 RepID=UPI002ED5CD74
MNNRWLALSIIFLSFLQFTLNWFNVIPTFGHLTTDLHLSLPQLGSVVGFFIAGYGIAHIPGGMLAEAYGMRWAMLFGIAVETVGSVWSSQAHSLTALLIGRFICGVGGSIYIGSAIGLTTAWFRDHQLVTANGLITGVAFTVGAAAGLYGWSGIVAAFGWRMALLMGAAVGALTFVALWFVFPSPPGMEGRETQGSHLDGAALRRIFANRDLWVIGLAFLGGYGSYFTAAELLPTYAQQHLGAGQHSAGVLGVIVLLSGIPGSFLGGWLADKLLGVIPTLVGALVVEAAALAAVPHVGMAGLNILAGIIGASGILAFVSWVAAPGLYRQQIRLADIPTACGLLLTIAAIGGVLVPTLYGRLAASEGYFAAWTFTAVVTLGTMACCLLARRPGATDAAHALGATS